MLGRKFLSSDAPIFGQHLNYTSPNIDGDTNLTFEKWYILKHTAKEVPEGLILTAEDYDDLTVIATPNFIRELNNKTSNTPSNPSQPTINDQAGINYPLWIIMVNSLEFQIIQKEKTESDETFTFFARPI